MVEEAWSLGFLWWGSYPGRSLLIIFVSKFFVYFTATIRFNLEI